jgi:hypothetical protein
MAALAKHESLLMLAAYDHNSEFDADHPVKGMTYVS